MILKNIKGLESSPLRIIEADELKEFIPKLQRVGTVCLVDYSQSPGYTHVTQVVLELNQEYMKCKTYILQNSDYHNVSLKLLGTHTLIFTINFNFNLLFR